MSIFGTILSKVFGSHPAASPPDGQAQPSDGAPPTAPTSPAPPPDEAGAAPAQPSAAEPIDVAKVLDEKAAHAGQTLDWRHSIVDLMKLLGMDSSLSARKELADELHFSGDKSDSASMNIWLHKQVMTKFAEHGGHLPPELKG